MKYFWMRVAQFLSLKITINYNCNIVRGYIEISKSKKNFFLSPYEGSMVLYTGEVSEAESVFLAPTILQDVWAYITDPDARTVSMFKHPHCEYMMSVREAKMRGLIKRDPKVKNITYELRVHILDTDINSVYRRANDEVYKKKSDKRHCRVIQSLRDNNEWISDGTSDENFDVAEEVKLLQEPLPKKNTVLRRVVSMLIYTILLIIAYFICLRIR